MTHRFLLFVLLASVACGSAVNTYEPEMGSAKFKHLLKGCLLLEARANKERTELKKTNVPLAAYYAQMFEAEGVSAEEFQATYDAYTQHPEALEAIYKEVADELKISVDSMAAAISQKPAQKVSTPD